MKSLSDKDSVLTAAAMFIGIFCVLHLYILSQVRHPAYPSYAPAPWLFPEWFKNHETLRHTLGVHPIFAQYSHSFWNHTSLITAMLLLGVIAFFFNLRRSRNNQEVSLFRLGWTTAAVVLLACDTFLNTKVRGTTMDIVRVNHSMPVAWVPNLLESLIYALVGGVVCFISASLLRRVRRPE
jgi:hypothetical protein